MLNLLRKIYNRMFGGIIYCCACGMYFEQGHVLTKEDKEIIDHNYVHGLTIKNRNKFETEGYVCDTCVTKLLKYYPGTIKPVPLRVRVAQY